MPRYQLHSHGDGYDLYVYDSLTQYPITPFCDDTPENYEKLRTLQARLEETEGPDYTARYKTFRHIETVRNYLNTCIRELLHRAEQHDQSKFESPEAEAYDAITHKLRGMTYGSDEYRATLKKYQPAIDHHYQVNPHHPEYHEHGMQDMTLLDLLEMLCDWKAATLRHDDGDLMRSITINQARFGYSEELATIFRNTARWLLQEQPFHKAHES